MGRVHPFELGKFRWLVKASITQEARHFSDERFTKSVHKVGYIIGKLAELVVGAVLIVFVVGFISIAFKIIGGN